jgi:hypothetical protein
MIVLSPKHPGLWFICEQCGALCGDVKENEIYEANDVYCPICHFKNQLAFNKKYEGIIKEGKEKEKC